MSREDAEQWWRALSTSQWSHAQELHGVVLGVEVLSHSVEDMRHFLERNWTPQRLIYGLENLVQEKLLSRSDASRVEQRILDKCGAAGTWA
jgi:hypothetical protein